MSELIRAYCPSCKKVNIFTDYGEFENKICEYCDEKINLDDWRDNKVEPAGWNIRKVI